MNTEIKILHSACCAKGSPIKAQLEQLAATQNIKVSIEELSELQDTMVYGTMSFPSLVVNGKVYDYRKVNQEAQLIEILKGK